MYGLRKDSERNVRNLKHRTQGKRHMSSGVIKSITKKDVSVRRDRGRKKVEETARLSSIFERNERLVTRSASLSPREISTRRAGDDRGGTRAGSTWPRCRKWALGVANGDELRLTLCLNLLSPGNYDHFHFSPCFTGSVKTTSPSTGCPPSSPPLWDTRLTSTIFWVTYANAGFGLTLTNIHHWP